MMTVSVDASGGMCKRALVKTVSDKGGTKVGRCTLYTMWQLSKIVQVPAAKGNNVPSLKLWKSQGGEARAPLEPCGAGLNTCGATSPLAARMTPC